MVKDKTQVCKFVKQKPSFSQLSPCKTHSPITAHTSCQRGEELEKLDCSIESYSPFSVAQVGFYILLCLNDRVALGGLIFNQAQMLDWECLHCMNNGCLSEGVAWGLLGMMRIKVAGGFTALLI